MRGQGTIEYILLLGGVIVVALIVGNSFVDLLESIVSSQTIPSMNYTITPSSYRVIVVSP